MTMLSSTTLSSATPDSATRSPDPESTAAELVPMHRWQAATWDEYCHYRDHSGEDRLRLFFDENSLLITDMGWEGIEHAGFCDLFTVMLFAWFARYPEQTFTSLGRCLMEKQPIKGGAPDLVIYLGDDYPQSQEGEKRRIDLHKWRVPDLIGEVSDTTLATDLDEKKRLYASLGIPEYWVIDVRGSRVFMFVLNEAGGYQACDTSAALAGLSVGLLEETIGRMKAKSNGKAALWFSQQLL